MTDDLSDLEEELKASAPVEESDDDETDGEDAEGGPRRRLSSTEFEEASVMWRSGRFSLEHIAKTFGVKPESLERRFYRNNVKRGSEAEEHVEAVKTSLRSKSEQLVERAEETRENHYLWSVALARLAMKTVIDAQSNNRALALVEGDLKSIALAMKIIKDARGERWVVLGLDKTDGDPEDMPELVVSVLTAEQIAKINEVSRTGGGVDLAEMGEIPDLGDMDMP